MSTQPEPDYLIAVVLATERGRTAPAATLSKTASGITATMMTTSRRRWANRWRRLGSAP